MIYGYIRVSTDKQTLENQVFEIENFCNTEGLKVNQWIMEKISGTTDFEKRQLGQVLKRLKADDILICSELSRLGRNLFQIMTILNKCMQKEAQVWTIKDNYRLGADIQSKVLAFAFSLSAEIERNLISQRTREALARIRANGKRLGRAKGSKNPTRVLDGKKQFILQQRRFGVPRAKIARKLGVSPSLMYKYLSKMKKKNQLNTNLHQ